MKGLVLLLVFLVLVGISYSYADESIDSLLKAKKGLEYSNTILNQQYEEVLKKIRLLKGRKNLSIFEELELGRLLSKALSISHQLDANTDELEHIKDKMKGLGYPIKEDISSTIRLRFLQDGLVDGPVELREKAMLLKDKEDKLQKEISILQDSEKKMRLKEEAQAFIKEQSVFDEDSTIAVVKQNFKSSTVENSTLSGSGSREQVENIDGGNTDSTLSVPSGVSSQNIKIKVEVSYEKRGILNQMDPDGKKLLVIDIDPERISADELRDKIELLKKIRKDIADARIELEQKALDLERVFREKK